MEILFLTISAVAVNFLVGFAAGRITRSQRPSMRQAQPTESNLEAVKFAAEYRNFLNYAGTEQDEIVI